MADVSPVDRQASLLGGRLNDPANVAIHGAGATDGDGAVETTAGIRDEVLRFRRDLAHRIGCVEVGVVPEAA